MDTLNSAEENPSHLRLRSPSAPGEMGFIPALSTHDQSGGKWMKLTCTGAGSPLCEQKRPRRRPTALHPPASPSGGVKLFFSVVAALNISQEELAARLLHTLHHTLIEVLLHRIVASSLVWAGKSKSLKRPFPACGHHHGAPSRSLAQKES